MKTSDKIGPPARKRMTSLKWFALITVASVILWTGWRVVKIWFNESLYCKRGSFEYVVAIRSQLIKTAPLIELAGEPEYHSSCGDGPKPPSNAIRYHSNATPQTIQPKIEIHLKSLGFSEALGDTWQGTIYAHGILYSNRDTHVELAITPTSKGSEVFIEQRW